MKAINAIGRWADFPGAERSMVWVSRGLVLCALAVSILRVPEATVVAQDAPAGPVAGANMSPLKVSVAPDGSAVACMHECSVVSVAVRGEEAWTTSSDAVLGETMRFAGDQRRVTITSRARSGARVIEQIAADERTVRRVVLRDNPARDGASSLAGLVVTADGGGVAGLEGPGRVGTMDAAGVRMSSVSLDFDARYLVWVAEAEAPYGLCVDRDDALARFDADGSRVWSTKLGTGARSAPAPEAEQARSFVSTAAVAVNRRAVIVRITTGVTRTSDGTVIVGAFDWADGRELWRVKVDILDRIAFDGPNGDWVRVVSRVGRVFVEVRDLERGGIVREEALTGCEAAAAVGLARTDWILWVADEQGSLRPYEVRAAKVQAEGPR